MLLRSSGSFALTGLSAHKVARINELFREWDLDGRDSIGMDNVLQVLQSAARTNDKEQKKWVKLLETQIYQARRVSRSQGSLTALRLQDGSTVNFSDQKGEPSLDPTAFRQLLLKVTGKDSEEEFDAFYESCLRAIRDAEAHTKGTHLKRLIWNMFRLLDRNHDGYIDLDEIAPLLKVQSRTDQKIVARFHHYLQNKRFMMSPDEEKEMLARHDSKFLNPAEGDVLDDVAPMGDSSSVKLGKRNSIVAADAEQASEKIKAITLADFHSFIISFFTQGGGSADEKVLEEKAEALLVEVKKVKRERELQYLQSHKVHEIINEMLEDVLKEEPLGVLAGFARSIERLQRTGKYPKQLSARSLSRNGSVIESK